MHALAAALTLVGAAGLGFVLVGTLSGPSTEASSDDPVLYSIGDVPSPVATPAGDSSPDSNPNAPQVPDASQAGVDPDAVANGDGDFTKGRLRAPAEAEPTPVPQTGTSKGGVRTAPSSVAFEPTDILIPKLDLSASIVPVGTNEAGEMESPRDYSEIGWWSPGARAGDNGRAVLAGHVDSPWGPAVFIDLHELQPGDEIIVGNGLAELRFIVRGAAVYRADAAPVEQIFGPSSEQELVLITCGGWFDRSTASYLHRRVVFAVLAEDSVTTPGSLQHNS